MAINKQMKKKSILLIILSSTLLLFVFLGYFGCAPDIEGGYVTSPEKAVQSSTVKGKQSKEIHSRIKLKEFLKQIESGEICMVEVYYIP